MQPRLLLLNMASLALIAALPGAPKSFAAEPPPDRRSYSGTKRSVSGCGNQRTKKSLVYLSAIALETRSA